jgi:vitamin B12 transporter
MFIRQQTYKANRQIIYVVFITALLFVFCMPLWAQTTLDSTKLLKSVIVSANKKPIDFTTTVPVQLLNHETLEEINTESIADAAEYFAGVLIKDYGGVGGLKTIAVRGLGALNTGMLYDGVPVADAQTGQIDLSKFSSTFVQSLELDEANPQQILLPARAYSSASVLSVATNSFNTTNFNQTKWESGVKEGSFDLWQPFAGIYLPASKSVIVSANAEAVWDKGNYPYSVQNGMFSENLNRINSDIKSFQGEANIVKQFKDSSQWQTKVCNYTSQRGLPGSIIFFNDSSSQRLWDEDFFVQSRYEKKISAYTSLLVSAKYSSLYTRYKDPEFLNNAGGIDDHYNQQEIYASAALSQRVGKYILMSVASDIASTNLTANTPQFPTPTRISLWNSFAIQFAKSHWQINGSLLNTNINDKTKTGAAATNKNEFTPTIAASYKLNAESPFLFRAYYKDIFRMPTFNDLYYTFLTSIDPKLLPEYSQQYNAGITYSKNFAAAIKQFSISIDGYYNTVKDKIITVPSPQTLLWTAENLGKVQIKGIDIDGEANGKFSSAIKWTARIAYSWQQALDVTDPTNGEYKNQIPYTPENSGSALASVYYKNWNAGYNFLFSGNRYALGANDPSNELPAWDTHGLFVSRMIRFQKFQTTIKAEADNIFNEMYDVVNYYPMPGRSYKISITFNNL